MNLEDAVDYYKSGNVEFYEFLGDIEKSEDITKESLLALAGVSKKDNEDFRLDSIVEKMFSMELYEDVDLTNQDKKDIYDKFIETHTFENIYVSMREMGYVVVNKLIDVDASYYEKLKEDIFAYNLDTNIFYISHPQWQRDLLDRMIDDETNISLRVENDSYDLNSEGRSSIDCSILETIKNWFILFEEKNINIIEGLQQEYNEANEVLSDLFTFNLSGYRNEKGRQQAENYIEFMKTILYKNALSFEDILGAENTEFVLASLNPVMFDKIIGIVFEHETEYGKRLYHEGLGLNYNHYPENFERLLVENSKFDKMVLQNSLNIQEKNKQVNRI